MFLDFYNFSCSFELLETELPCEAECTKVNKLLLRSRFTPLQKGMRFIVIDFAPHKAAVYKKTKNNKEIATIV